VADAAEGLSAVHHHARLLLRLARQRPVRESPFSLVAASARSGRSRSEPVGWSDRQSIGQDERKRPTAGLRWAKKIKGRKHHIATDTGVLLVGAEIHSADIQDRDGDALAKFGNWTVEIVKPAAPAAGFKLLPRRWVVERIFAWLNRNRRLAKDFEASIASAKAWVYIASVQLLIRGLI
jgi:putative transposase